MRDEGSGRSSWGARVAAGVVAALVGLVVVWPACVVGRGLVDAALQGKVKAASAGVSVGLLASTIGWASGIAALAVVVGLPGAVWIARRGWRAGVWVVLPLLLPSYLCYAGYGLLRAPRSVIGDWIESAAQDGATWLPVLAGRVVAVVGLTLWAWPIASVVIALGLRGVSRDAMEMVRLDHAGLVARLAARAGLVRGWILGAWGVVALVMVGSAVPLHLAQAPTYSVRVWFEMSIAPGSAAAWVSAWPLMFVAGVAAWMVSRRMRQAGGAVPEGRRGLTAGGGRSGWGMWALLGLSVLLPCVLLAMAVDSWASFGAFWALNGEALGASAMVAAGTGVCLAGLAALVWMAMASFDGVARRVVMAAVVLLLFAACVPGVLVGQATAQAWEWSHAVRDWPGLVVMGQVARFGGVAGVLGWALARSESRGERDARLLDGATGLMGFLGMVAPGRMAACAGVGVAGACLSLHEIEVSVFLQSPGSPGLAQVMLGYLHYSRMSDLSAAGVWLVGFGVVGAAIVGMVMSRVKGWNGVQP